VNVRRDGAAQGKPFGPKDGRSRAIRHAAIVRWPDGRTGG
jgi:hypothetical protein